jgi:hypothetical protein
VIRQRRVGAGAALRPPTAPAWAYSHRGRNGRDPSLPLRAGPVESFVTISSRDGQPERATRQGAATRRWSLR